MNNLISIIVPVYKVEKYLPKCINSIINQTYKNLEIILVDDGSPDNCPNMIEEYARNDKRIKIIHKENGGLSSARNAGLEIATGDYISFVDSDDYVRRDYIEILLNNLKNANADISICKNKKFSEGEEIIINEVSDVEIYNKKQLIYELFKFGAVHECAWGKLYAKKLFDNIRFPIGRIYEDSSIMHEIYNNVEKAVYTNNELYYYLVNRSDSIMGNTYSAKKQHDNYLFIIERQEYLLKNLPELRDLATAGFIRNSITVFERTYTMGDSDELKNNEIMIELEKIVRNELAKVDKNVLAEILDTYKLASLYLFLQNKNVYAKAIKELKESRN